MCSVLLSVHFSKKKLCVIYGKWTECMWAVDPQVYEAHRKADKKGSSENKKNKQVGYAATSAASR